MSRRPPAEPACPCGSGAPLVDTAAAREVWCFTPTVDDEGRMGGALTRWPDYRGSYLRDCQPNQTPSNPR